MLIAASASILPVIMAAPPASAQVRSVVEPDGGPVENQAAGHAEGRVGIEAAWVPPVDAPIVDFFRAPAHRYGPGNRGLEYGARSGQRVGAVADGVVTFAGQVGGRLFVVVSHRPELASTYAYLESSAVDRGDSVVQGQRVGTAGPGFHLTARLRGRYIDPLPLFGWRYRVRLVAPATVPASTVAAPGEGGIRPRKAIG